MRVLNTLYAAGAILAAVFMVLIAVLTLIQILGRMLGVLILDAGDFAGYAMAASIFLALAHTFRTGGHIRVNLLLAHSSPRVRHALEIWCLAFMLIVGGLLAAFSIKMTLESFSFGDVSTGMVPVPLWIPQLSMAFGAALLEIAVLEELICVLRGKQPRYETAEASIESYSE
jgi:TRAP-type C4-dicarboxylate transport system permease small subunit